MIKFIFVPFLLGSVLLPDFFSNGRGSSLELLANQYICYVDRFHWDMDEELLTLGDLDESLETPITLNPADCSLEKLSLKSQA